MAHHPRLVDCSALTRARPLPACATRMACWVAALWTTLNAERVSWRLPGEEAYVTVSARLEKGMPVASVRVRRYPAVVRGTQGSLLPLCDPFVPSMPADGAPPTVVEVGGVARPPAPAISPG